MGFFDRFRKGSDEPSELRPPDIEQVRAVAPESPPAAPEPADSELSRLEVTERIETLVRGGFLSKDDVLSMAVEMADDEEYDIEESDVEVLVDEIWVARLAEQSTWPPETEADRFAAAFADLDRSGVVSRMNFTCCQPCGTTEIDDEVAPGTSPRGYTFFHQQDAERLADSGPLFLSFGVFTATDKTDYEAKAVAVAGEVVAAIERRGLPVEWDGSEASRIKVGPMDWRRRLPTD